MLKYLVKNGDCVIDIGANAGWYTKILSELVGESGIVYSIEPIPPTFELLSYCVKKLGLKNVRLINCAVSADNRIATMEVPDYDSGGANYYQARVIKDHKGHAVKQFSVTTRTLNSLFGDAHSKTTFIKCDVEGHEADVIKGAERLIELVKPSWLMEISGDPDSPASDAFAIFRYMEKHGYSAYWFDGQELNRRNPGDHSTNYFFLNSKHVELIRTSEMKLRM